jgi:shikimate kinase
MNLYFCGMIGSGKTTIGSRLAAETGLDFFDLDREMDAALGHSFHKLVAEKGWLAFRELEYSIVKGFAGKTNSIICLGGGTVRYEWNIDAIRGTGLVLLLQASVEELVRRVRMADRPRVNAGTTLEQDIELMWKNEGHKYLRAADLVYTSDHKSLDQEVAELKSMLVGDARFAGILKP